MGLAEQRTAGAALERKTTTFTTAPSGTGSVNLDASYVILSIQTSNACRIRLYEDTGSRDDVNEISRSFGDVNISPSVALVGDISMSAAGRYTTDPVLYGVTYTSSLTYYRIEPTSPPTTLNITTYTIEDGNIPPGVGSYIINNRRNLPEIQHQLTSGSYATGSLSGSNVPKTFLFVSSSLSGSNSMCRLRFYSKSGSLVDNNEINRPFYIEPTSSNNYLILDMVISGSDTIYFKPKIIGASFKTLRSNLQEVIRDRNLIVGDNEIYYVLQEISGSGQIISSSTHVYSLED